MTECANRGLKYAPIVQCYVEGHPFADTHTDSLVRGYGEAQVSYFVSQTNLDCVRRQLAFALPNGRVVSNPFNVSYQAAPPWPLHSGEFHLACVARLDLIVKGQDILFEVLAQPKWKARPLYLSLYGAGPNEQSLRRLAQMYDLRRVHFRGTTNDIEGMWRDHHGLVLTSRWEGLPLAVVEAMLCGRVPIVTEGCGSADYIEDNVSGFVAQAAKFSLVDEALERAWNRRNDWEQIGRVASQVVRYIVPASPERVFAEEILALAQGAPFGAIK
jgi:glycosyltransferase involved in cell wall biosynthesis